MKIPLFSLIFVTVVSGTFGGNASDDSHLVAAWNFDEESPTLARDTVSQRDDAVSGFAQRLPGVRGQALRLDGYTTAVIRKAEQAPQLTQGFTLAAWVALEAYPWGPCAIVSQVDQPDAPVLDQDGMAPQLEAEKDPAAGFFFGLTANGNLLLQLAIDGQWITCRSAQKIPLLRWTQVGGVYDPAQRRLALYVDGTEVASAPNPKGEFRAATALDLLVGRNPKPRPPEHPIRLNLPALYALEGLLDEVRIHDRPRTAAEIQRDFASLTPPAESGLHFPKLPASSGTQKRFGAYSTRLTYHEPWDVLRREGPASDVVVRFDEHPWQYLFWRGTNYIPHWVTENGIWYTNEFNETWGHGALGCAEPMSDKQARYSRVQIIESSAARVVVHWRYALVDTRYRFARQDPVTGWGDWSDEYHTIYPDGTGVRKIQLWSSQPLDAHEFQESIVLIPAGARPEDVIEPEAVTMINLRGESHRYSWAERPPDKLDQPAQANIEVINTKSRARPFLIVSDEPFEEYGLSHPTPLFRPFNMEVKRENSIFPWWNHWPVAQIPSDGRWATEADRIGHSSLSTGLEWKNWEVTPTSRTRIMLHGLTEREPHELARLGRSWLRAPQLKGSPDNSLRAVYDQSERAYVVTDYKTAPGKALAFTLDASDDHPLVNPAFIVKQWPAENATLTLNDEIVRPGSRFRSGIRYSLEGDDLIVWLKLESTEPVHLQLLPAGQP